MNKKKLNTVYFYFVKILYYLLVAKNILMIQFCFVLQQSFVFRCIIFESQIHIYLSFYKNFLVKVSLIFPRSTNIILLTFKMNIFHTKKITIIT